MEQILVYAYLIMTLIVFIVTCVFIGFDLNKKDPDGFTLENAGAFVILVTILWPVIVAFAGFYVFVTLACRAIAGISRCAVQLSKRIKWEPKK